MNRRTKRRTRTMVKYKNNAKSSKPRTTTTIKTRQQKTTQKPQPKPQKPPTPPTTTNNSSKGRTGMNRNRSRKRRRPTNYSDTNQSSSSSSRPPRPKPPPVNKYPNLECRQLCQWTDNKEEELGSGFKQLRQWTDKKEKDSNVVTKRSTTVSKKDTNSANDQQQKTTTTTTTTATPPAVASPSRRIRSGDDNNDGDNAGTEGDDDGDGGTPLSLRLFEEELPPEVAKRKHILLELNRRVKTQVNLPPGYIYDDITTIDDLVHHHNPPPQPPPDDDDESDENDDDDENNTNTNNETIPPNQKNNNIKQHNEQETKFIPVDFTTVKKFIVDGTIATITDFVNYFERIIRSSESTILPEDAKIIISRAHLLVATAQERWSNVATVTTTVLDGDDGDGGDFTCQKRRRSDVDGSESNVDGVGMGGALSELNSTAKKPSVTTTTTEGKTHVTKSRIPQNNNTLSDEATNDSHHCINNVIDKSEEQYPKDAAALPLSSSSVHATLELTKSTNNKTDGEGSPTTTITTTTQERQQNPLEEHHQSRSNNPIKKSLLNLNRRIQTKLHTHCFNIDDVTKGLSTLEELIHKEKINNVDEFERNLGDIIYSSIKRNWDKYLSVHEQTRIIESHALPLLQAARKELVWVSTSSLASSSTRRCLTKMTGSSVSSRSSSCSSSSSSSSGCNSSSSSSSSGGGGGDNVEVGRRIVLDSTVRSTSSRIPRKAIESSGDGMIRVYDSSSSSPSGREMDTSGNCSVIPSLAPNWKMLETSGDEANRILQPSESLISSLAPNCEKFDVSGDQSCNRAAKETTNDKIPVLSCDFSLVDASTPHCCRDMSTSIMTPCSSTKEWLKLCPQLLMACNEAARRAALWKNSEAPSYDKPLSEVYMRERLQYHDLLEGEYVWSKVAPHHLQGFVITTNFTTWRRTLRWTAESPTALITPLDHRTNLTDKDGSLTDELQKVSRIGTNSKEGYIFHRVREITLLGGLGCGGALISKTLSNLRKSGKYDYVVLQSTKIAIPFYEKHGFIRVGAVARLLDNDAMPEVAYRHWSEIVGGLVIEPSYMMALRLDSLNDAPFRRSVSKVRDIISIDERKCDIISSLKSTYFLLLESLLIRATGSTAYSNSYRELLCTALEFSRSAGDYDMFCTIEKCISQCHGEAIGISRRIINTDLGVRKKTEKRKRLNVYEGSRNREFIIPPTLEIEATKECLMSKKDVKVTAKINTKKKSEGKYMLLEASLPNALVLKMIPFTSRGCKKKREFAVKLEIATVLGNSIEECSNNDSILRAITTILPPRGNIDDIREYQQLAIHNLWTIAFNKAPCQRSGKTGDYMGKSIVEAGDKIMFRLQSHFGIIPGWIEALVEKCGQDDQCGTNNSFIVTWDDEGKRRSASRFLSQDNRGVGREWCTILDWHSFTVLPVAILDALILESWFDYQTNDGIRVWGEVFTKVGTGLNYGLKWRFKVSCSESNKSVGTYQDLHIKTLREFIDISDENYARATKLLKSRELDLEKSTWMSKENSLKLPAKYIDNPNNEAAYLWSISRIKEHLLFSSNDKTRARNDLLMKKKDDGTLTYPTNVEAEKDKEIDVQSLIQVSPRQEENGSSLSSEELRDENESEENRVIKKRGLGRTRKRKKCVSLPHTESHNDSKIGGTGQHEKRRQEKTEVCKRRPSSSTIMCTDEIVQIRKSRRCRLKAVPSAN